MQPPNSKSRKCIYAGSFDPVTNGHFWMIQEASRLFDELIVAIGINPQKKCHYPLTTRLEMMKKVVGGLDNVSVTSFSTQFLVNFATTQGADFILRGIRGETDFEYERGMRYINDRINSQVSTIFLIPPKQLSETSSSMVRGLMGPPGWTHIVQQFVPQSIFYTLLEYELKNQFHLSFAKLASSPDTLDHLFNDLIERHKEQHRYYHTLTHIAECIAEHQSLEHLNNSNKKDLEETRTVIDLAIWFHDVIYDPKSKSNEADSMQFFHTKTQQLTNLSTEMKSRVLACIEASQTHQISNLNSHNNQPDPALEYFLDIDLSILGADEPRLMEYNSGIRQEYNCIPNLIFNPMRKKILRAYLNREPLYRTEEFRQRYEARAKLNLKKLIDND